MGLLNLVAKLSLDKSQYEGGLKDAEKDVGGFGSKISKGLSTVGKIGVAAIGAASAAVVGFAKSAVSTGIQFDSSMSQVAATMADGAEKMIEYNGKTMRSIDALRDFAMEMGATTAFSATESAQALNYMALAGYDAETSMKMLPNVLSLASAGGIELAAASDMVTDAQSALGLSIDETSAMVDQMARAASKSNTSVAQLGDAMLTIGATARNVKGGTVELSTVLGVLADNGIKGAEGGTHLRNMLLSLQSPTDEGAEALKKLGVAVYDAEGNMRALPDIFLEMQAGMEGMSQASKDAIIGGIFNKTDLAAANALIGTSAERFADLTTQIGQSTGAAKDMAGVQLDNLAGSITLFKSALEGAKIIVSDQLTPTLSKFVGFGSEAIQKLSLAFKDGGLSGAMSALKEVLSDGLKMVIETIPSVIDAGVQLLIALVTGIIENLPTLATAAVQIIQTVIDTIITNFPLLLESGKQALEQLVSGMDPVEMINKGGELLNSFLTKVYEYLPTLLDSGMQFVSRMASGVMQNLPAIVSAIANVLSNLINTIMQNLPKFLQKGIEIIGKMSSGLLQNLPTIISSLTSLLLQLITTIAQNLPQFLQKGIELVGQMAAGLVSAIPTILSSLGSMLTDMWNKVTNIDWGTLGSNIIDGIKNGIVNAASRLASAALEAVKNAFNGMKKWLNVQSPSKRARDEIGKNWALGIAEGFDENLPVDDMVNTVESAFDSISNIAATSILEPETNANSTYGKLTTVVSEMTSAVKDLQKVGVFLNGRTLVGKLTPDLDMEMGSYLKFESRRVR